MNASTSQQILEVCLTEDAGLANRIDEAAGVIRGVKILGRESKNGRVYTQDCLEGAVALYEGAQVNLDHKPEQSRLGEPRGVLEGWGVLQQVHLRRDGIFGDLHYWKEHAATPVLIERVRRMPDKFGLSHDASGVMTPGHPGDPDIVEAIEDVNSVDLVSRPATNSSLFESHQTERKAVATTPPKDRKVRQVLETKRSAEGRRLRKLLEADEFAAMADEPVAVAAGSDPEAEMQASIESLVLAVLRDDTLDAGAKLQKIRQVLGVQDKLNDKGGEPAGGGESDKGEGGGGSGPMNEAQKKILERLEAAERREQLAEALEDAGWKKTDLQPAQRKLLESATGRDQMDALLESWGDPPAASGGQNGHGQARGYPGQSANGARPNVRSILAEQQNVDPGNDSYDSLRESALSGARKAAS